MKVEKLEEAGDGKDAPVREENTEYGRLFQRIRVLVQREFRVPRIRSEFGLLGSGSPSVSVSQASHDLPQFL